MSTQTKSFSADRGIEGVSLEATAAGLSLGGTRALLYSHVAIEMLRRQLFHQLGDELARAILAQTGRHAGFNDAQILLQTKAFDGVEAMLETQYGLLASSGFGRFQILDLAVNPAAKEMYTRVRCDGAPEAESHRRLFGKSRAPACCHLVGYSTGWSSAVVGVPVLTIESHCVAKGDDHCEFETMPYAEFVGPEASFWKQAFESTSKSLAQQLAEQLEVIQRQMATIQEQQEDIARLSTPVLQISDRVLVMPIIGSLDPARVATISEALLEAIVRRRAAGVIIDLTGVAVLDTTTAAHLIGMFRSVRLLGAKAVLSGISPSMSQVLVAEGTDLLAEIATRQTLQGAVRYIESRIDADG